MPSREGIYRDIETERLAQDSRWGGAARDDSHREEDWAALVARHLGLALGESAGVGHDPARFRRQMVRVAALAVAAVESHDRRHGRGYVAGRHEPGSGF